MRRTLTSEQEEIRALALDFFASTTPAQERISGGQHSPTLWKRMAEEVGFQGLVIPEAFGGLGCGAVELGMVLEAAGRTLTAEPLFATSALATTALLRTAPSQIRSELLEGIASGKRVATVALESTVSGTSTPTVRVRRVADDWVASGHETLVIAGECADTILLFASTDLGVGLFLVEDPDRVVRRPLVSLDPTRRLARLEFDDVSVRPLGDLRLGPDVLAAVIQMALIGLAFDSVGGSSRCLEMSVDYARTREQFGRPIGSFQAIKHKCADMLLRSEAARSTAYHAAWLADDGFDQDIRVRLAKVYCADAYFAVAAENIQIHGGIGFTWEHPAHLYFKRAKSSQHFFGSPEWHRAAMGRSLQQVEEVISAMSQH